MKNSRWIGFMIGTVLVALAIFFFVPMSPAPSSSSSDTVSVAKTSKVVPHQVQPTKPVVIGQKKPLGVERLNEPKSNGNTPAVVALEEVITPPKKPVLGSLSAKQIDDGVREVMPELLGCYQDALEVVPGLDGRLTAKFTISNEEGVGRIMKAEIIDADFDDVPMEECILDTLEDVDFPSTGGGIVIVRYPFNFSPE